MSYADHVVAEVEEETGYRKGLLENHVLATKTFPRSFLVYHSSMNEDTELEPKIE